MKKQIACIAGLCLALAGCAAPQAAETTVPQTSVVSTVTTQAADPAADGPVAFSGAGKVRVEYQGNRSGVVYVTEPSQLPDVAELKKFDEAFFEDHALVLVTDTVSSGSVRIELDKIAARDGTASVTLNRTMPGDAGTTDMATWLLWAEVEPGLEYQWEIANPGLPDNTETK